MHTATFRDFICNRGYDDFLPGVEARLRPQNVACDVHYATDAPVPTLRLRFENKKAVYEVILWESGDCEMQVLDFKKESFVFHKHERFSSPIAFLGGYGDPLRLLGDEEENA
jgi:hypothetical protein